MIIENSGTKNPNVRKINSNETVQKAHNESGAGLNRLSPKFNTSLSVTVTEPKDKEESKKPNVGLRISTNWIFETYIKNRVFDQEYGMDNSLGVVIFNKKVKFFL